MSDTSGTTTQPGTENPPPVEDAGTLRTNFETQLADRDKTIAMLQRGNALATAIPGVNLLSPPVQAFLEKYDGELDVDAMKAKAAEWNIGAPPAPAGDPNANTTTDPPTPTSTTAPVSTAEAQAHLDAAAAGGTGTGAGTGTVDPQQAGLDAYHAELKAGRSEKDASIEYFDRVMKAAAQGDPRVLVLPGQNPGR